MTTTRTDNRLGPADRAVYHLVEAGAMNAALVPLYRLQLSRLRRAGLVQRTDDGGYSALMVKGETAPATTPPPSEPPSAAWHDLPEYGPTASQEPDRAPHMRPRSAPPPAAPWAVHAAPARPRRVPMAKIVALVPAKLLAKLDERGPTRSEALRAVLQAALH